MLKDALPSDTQWKKYDSNLELWVSLGTGAWKAAFSSAMLLNLNKKDSHHWNFTWSTCDTLDKPLLGFRKCSSGQQLY